MSSSLPDNFGVFPIGARVEPDPRFTYLTPEQRREWLELATPVHFEAPDNVRCVLGQAYGEHPKQRLDLYFPAEAEGPLPLIIYVHGGGWSVGERDSSYINCCFHCIDHGFAIMAVDYRLLPETGWPDNLADVCLALDWAREHSGEYGLDPGRFGIIGDSAGGHLALMCALKRPDAVRAVCAQFAPTIMLPRVEDEMYLESGLARHGPPSVPPLYAVLAGSEDEQTLLSCSPISHIGADIPPAFLQHGTRDALVPYQMSTRFAERARELYPDCCVEYKLYDGFVHSDPRFLSQGPQEDVLRFFSRHLAR